MFEVGIPGAIWIFPVENFRGTIGYLLSWSYLILVFEGDIFRL